MRYHACIRYYRLALWCIALLLLVGEKPPTHARPTNPIYLVEVSGVVTDVTASYLRRALDVAESGSANALIIQLGNNGAVLRSLHPLATDLAQAEVPVVVFVAPPGSDAGAAGAFLLSAAHISAMAPDTAFGSPEPLASVEAALTEQTQHLVMDAIAEQLRTWNERQERNSAWVDRAVQDGRTWTNEQAIQTKPPIINLVARDVGELLMLLHGRTVVLHNGKSFQLETIGREATPIAPNIVEELLLFLADPTVMFLLLVLSFFAIYGEFANPGVGILAGLAVVLFLAAIVGMVVLPIQWLSLIGLFLAFGLMIADLFAPSHGTLAVIGIVLMILCSLTLIDSAQAPGVFVAFWAIFLIALLVAIVVAIGIWLIIRTGNQPPLTGQESLIGKVAEVRDRLAPSGMVFVQGALWRAVSEDGDVDVGEWVRITAVHDLRLIVRRVNEEQLLDQRKDEAV